MSKLVIKAYFQSKLGPKINLVVQNVQDQPCCRSWPTWPPRSTILSRLTNKINHFCRSLESMLTILLKFANQTHHFSRRRVENQPLVSKLAKQDQPCYRSWPHKINHFCRTWANINHFFEPGPPSTMLTKLVKINHDFVGAESILTFFKVGQQDQPFWSKLGKY